MTFSPMDATATTKKKVKNVIFLIGDGMSQGTITLARYVKGEKLAMDAIACGLVHTSWIGGPITDSAAGGTALATGYKTIGGYVGISPAKTPIANLVEGARMKGKATGIIATSEITHATPADFVTHVENRHDYHAIMTQQIHSGVDVFLGGGYGKASKYIGRDGNELATTEYADLKKRLQKEMQDSNYKIVTTKAEMQRSQALKLWGIFADAQLSYELDRKEKKQQEVIPTLAEMTRKAISILSKDKEGFFLMIEGSKIDWAAHNNQPVAMTSEIIAFDKAVEEAIRFAKKDGNTLVVVTTDHGNSGLTIGRDELAFSYSKVTFDESVNVLKSATVTEALFNQQIKGKTNKEILALADTKFGIKDLNNAELTTIKEQGMEKVLAQRAKIGFTTTGHTGEDVYLGIYAPASVHKLNGVVENTAIPQYIATYFLGESNYLDVLTKQSFQNGRKAFEQLGAIVSMNDTDKTNPIAVVTKGKTVLELDLCCNTYRINGVQKRSKTVIPYVNGTFFVSVEIIQAFQEQVNKTT